MATGARFVPPYITAILGVLLVASAAHALPSQGAFSTLPGGGVQETGTATNAAATNTATLAAVVGRLTYLTGLQISGGGATAASVIACTVTGLAGGTITIDVPIPAGATGGITPVVLMPVPPWTSSAPNTAIAVSCPTFGSGNTIAAVSDEGYVF